MADKLQLRKQLEAEWESLVPLYNEAVADDDKARMKELEAAAKKIDAVLDMLAIADLQDLAKELKALSEYLGKLKQKLNIFSSSDASAATGTKPAPQIDDDDRAADEHITTPAMAAAATTPNGSGTGWRVAKSLLKLRSQIDAAAPNRSTASDGTIGDSRHWPEGNKSDHNPWVSDNGRPVVTAMDVTNDPARGCAVQSIADALVASRDSRVKYIIFNRRMVSSIVEPWIWRPYPGGNPHDKHMHVSVNPVKAQYDGEADWQIGMPAPIAGAPHPLDDIVRTFDVTHPIAWGKKVGGSFKAKTVEIANRLQMDPNVLMAIMAFETERQFKASTPAHASSAVGLIQFMPSTAQSLGTTSAALAAMSEVEQLDYVYEYLKPYIGKLNSTASAYMAVLWPAAVKEAESFVLFTEGHHTYDANRGLDGDRDGKVTKAEAAAKVKLAMEEGMRPENFG